MRPKIRCDGESTVLLQKFFYLNWALVPHKLKLTSKLSVNLVGGRVCLVIFLGGGGCRPFSFFLVSYFLLKETY
jgi:hypothetical protein